MSSLEITQTLADKIQNAVNNFIWQGKKPKIKQKVAYQNIEKGGLAIPNIDKLLKANRASWIKRLLDVNNRSKQYLSMFLPKLDFNDFIRCNYNPLIYQIIFQYFISKFFLHGFY